MPAPWVRYLASPERWADPPAKGNISLWERANTIPDRIRQSNHARAVYDKLMDEERQRIANENAMRKAIEGRDQAILAREAVERETASLLLRCERLRARLRAAGVDPDGEDE